MACQIRAVAGLNCCSGHVADFHSGSALSCGTWNQDMTWSASANLLTMDWLGLTMVELNIIPPHIQIPTAHAGLRLMRDDLRSYFRLAVQQAEATSLHDVTWCEWHHMKSWITRLLTTSTQITRSFSTGCRTAVSCRNWKKSRETIFGTSRRTPPQRSVHMRVQPTLSIQHELHRFVWSFSWDTLD